MSAYYNVKTALFMGALYGVLVGIGSLLGGGTGMAWAVAIASIFNLIAYFYSDRIVLAMYKAQPLSQESHPKIYTMVEELCESAKLPLPKIWIIQSNNANAFATGRNPSHASIAFTTSIIKLLDADELRAVAAHELSHVKNRDILIGTLAATLAAAIAYCADMVRWSMFWGSNDRENRKHGWVVVMMSVIFAPLIATLIQLAISRSREFQADESGAHLCHEPLALASALEKLHSSPKMDDSESYAKASTAHLFISNPFKGSSLLKLFSTHPPLEERVKRFRAMTH